MWNGHLPLFFFIKNSQVSDHELLKLLSVWNVISIRRPVSILLIYLCIPGLASNGRLFFKKNNFFLAVVCLCCCAGFSIVRCAGFSLWCFSCCRAWALRHTGFRSCGSQALEHRPRVVVHELRCSEARRIFPDQGSNPCLLHWQADYLPLRHQGNP